MSVKQIPEGFHTLTPYIIIKDSQLLADFLKKAFDAQEIDVVRTPDGLIRNAQLKVGDSMIMFAEAISGYESMPTGIYMYVEDTDAVYKKSPGSRRCFNNGTSQPVLRRTQCRNKGPMWQ